MQDFIKLKQQLEILWQEVLRLEKENPEPGTSDYTELTNKPSINGVELNGNKTSSQLDLITASDITDAFTPSTISIEDGETFPSASRALLTEHKPIMINGTQYWFLAESGVDYLYGSIPYSGAYPTITYFRIMKADFTVEFHETATDTVPADNSDNFITSGGVYTAIQSAGGGTDLTPVNVGAKAATFPTEYMYVLEKHLPFTTGETVSGYSGTTWIYYTENSSYYVYIQYLGSTTISSSYNNAIRYRYAIINKSDKTWTQGASPSDVSTVITTKTLPYNAFNGVATPLSSDVNLNYSVNSGLFFCPNASSVVNSPTTNPFFIEAQWIQYTADNHNYTYIKQILTDFTTKDVYYRTFSGTTWSSWYKITATVVS